jgi:penicillin G amidase
MQKATVQDMFAMQNDTYSVLAANTLPVMLKYLPDTFQVKKWNDVAGILREWNYTLTAESEAATLYHVWWSLFFRDMWSPVFGNAVPDHLMPLQERTMQFLQANIDPARHAQVDGYYADLAKKSFNETVDSVMKLEKTTGTEWYKVKNTTVAHLTKLPAFSYDHLKIGGWGNTINAAKGDHGPSWRMVVQMGKEIEAYGVYPGGQSGNPGSKYYADFLDRWVEGKYYKLEFLPDSDHQNSNNIKYTWRVNSGQ